MSLKGGTCVIFYLSFVGFPVSHTPILNRPGVAGAGGLFNMRNVCVKQENQNKISKI